MVLDPVEPVEDHPVLVVGHLVAVKRGLRGRFVGAIAKDFQGDRLVRHRVR